VRRILEVYHQIADEGRPHRGQQPAAD